MATLNPDAIMQAILQQQMQMQQNQPELVAPKQKTEDEMKRQRIRDALANFGMMATTTPGNALQGISTALGGAGKTYQDSRKEQDKLSQEFYDKEYKRQQQAMKDVMSGASSVASNRQANASSARAERGLTLSETLRLQAEERAQAAEKRAAEKHTMTRDQQIKAEKRAQAAEKRAQAAEVYSMLGLDDPLMNYGGMDTPEYKAAMKQYMDTRRRLYAPNAPQKPAPKTQKAPGRPERAVYGTTWFNPETGIKEVFDGRGNWLPMP